MWCIFHEKIRKNLYLCLKCWIRDTNIDNKRNIYAMVEWMLCTLSKISRVCFYFFHWIENFRLQIMAPLENERKQEFIIFTRRQTYHAPFDGKLFITFDEPKKLLTENRGQKHISSEMVWAVRLIKENYLRQISWQTRIINNDSSLWWIYCHELDFIIIYKQSISSIWHWIWWNHGAISVRLFWKNVRPINEHSTWTLNSIFVLS